MLNGFDTEISEYISGRRHYISTIASLYLIFLVETYFTRHENIRNVNDKRFEETWASRYFLPRMSPDLMAMRILSDSEPFIIKLTGGMFMLRKPNDEFVVSDIITILYKYKQAVEERGGILFHEERYPIGDFLQFLSITMDKLG